MRKLLPYALCLMPLVSNPAFAGFDTNARSAFMIDYDSGAEIYAKSADDLMPPSSMLKLVTLAVTFDALKSGELKMDDKLPVSKNADYQDPNWKTASKICLSAGQTVSVHDAIMGAIVLSGGDACVVLAEKLAGSESAFTAKMTARARAFGMSKSTFGNSTGLPDPKNLMTTRELATLATHLISDYPDFYPLFATRRFEFNDYKSDWCVTWGQSHNVSYNKILFMMPGADGLKTGQTDAGGYGVVASARQGGRRLIGVINGFAARDHDQLAREAKKLLEYGFATTQNKIFYKPGDNIAKIPVWYGRSDVVIATVARPFAVTFVTGTDLSTLRILARYNDPAIAPVDAGAQIGTVIAELNGQTIARAPLVAKDRVGKTILFGRLFKNLMVLFGGK